MVKSNWAATFFVFCNFVVWEDYSFSFSFGLVFGLFFVYFVFGQLAYRFKWSVKWIQLEWIIKWLNLLCLMFAMCMEWIVFRAHYVCDSQILLIFSANFDIIFFYFITGYVYACSQTLSLIAFNQTVYTVQFNYLCRCNRRIHTQTQARLRRIDMEEFDARFFSSTSFCRTTEKLSIERDTSIHSTKTVIDFFNMCSWFESCHVICPPFSWLCSLTQFVVSSFMAIHSRAIVHSGKRSLLGLLPCGQMSTC